MFALLNNPADVALRMADDADEEDYQDEIAQARNYDRGEQFVVLTERLREFLGGDVWSDSEDWKRLRLNICRIILSAPVDRLIVSGFDTDEAARESPTTDENGQPTRKLIKPVAAWAWLTWQRNRMDAKQRRVHEAALRDSEAFVIVDWDNAAKRARFTPHVRFIDTSGTSRADTGEGCRAYYRNDDPDQDLLFVTKRWLEVMHDPAGVRSQRQRLTVYLPGEIRKYAGYPGAWEKTVDSDAEPWPIPWTDKRGQPLGIPVAHFISSAGMEAREAWPIQNAINKAFVDLMAESDIAAFRIAVAFGWKPVDADGNPITFTPGTIIGTKEKDARLDVHEGGDLNRFINLIEGMMVWAAQMTDTPVGRFITTKQVSSEGSQKEQNSPLLTKTRNRQSEMAIGWAHMMYLAMRLENTYGKGGLDETAFITATFEPLEARDRSAELDMALKMKNLGIPISIIAAALGMTPEQTALWMEDAQAKAEAQARVSSNAFGGIQA